LVLQNKRLLGSFAGSIRPRLDLPKLLDLYRGGRLPLDGLVTKHYPLDDLEKAFADMEAGEVARGVLMLEPRA
jgi:S-(hydroxymethyl)glutathione dehydrogenase/alcohol dehydrogenase